MLDRHAVQKLLRAGMRPRVVAKQFGVSRRTTERIAREGPMGRTRMASSAETRRQRWEVGRPQATPAVRAHVEALVLEDLERPPGEI